MREVTPLIRYMISLGARDGGQLRNRCTWSGRISSDIILQSSPADCSLNSERRSFSTGPINTFRRLLGDQTKWMFIRDSVAISCLYGCAIDTIIATMEMVAPLL